MWYKEKEEILKQLETSSKGITNSEANKRLKKEGLNRIPTGKKNTIWNIIIEQLKNQIIFILFFSAIFSIITQSKADAIFIFVVIGINTIMLFVEDDSSEDSGNNGETNKPGDENNGGNTGNEGSNNGGSNNNGSNNGGSNSGVTEEQGAKVYTGKNNVTHDSETGLSMARKALEETLKVEDVNGKKYVTLTFTPMGSKMMNNHTVYVNGAKVEATKSVNGEIVSLRFAVGSLEDSIKVSAYVTMMGSNVERKI